MILIYLLFIIITSTPHQYSSFVTQFKNKMQQQQRQKTFGLSYQISPNMKSYLQNIQNPLNLKHGFAIFKGQFVFGQNYQQVYQKLYKTSKQKIGKSPNTMHTYGSENVIQAQQLNRLVTYIKPFVDEYFQLDTNKKLELTLDFSVHYGGEMDKKLQQHRDDSDITVNICLRNTFKTTGLMFNMIPDTLFSKFGIKQMQVDLQVGNILIHRGDQLHQVRPVTAEDAKNQNSERVNLILWFKSV